jgi:hypothetical protein
VSSKPLVNALATAAAPDLRAWVNANADTVENVVDAALEVPDDVTLAEEVNFSAPTPLAFGDVADLADDGLTDEQRKRALAWLKKRADRSEGEFDAEVAHDAISLLPGWSSEVLETRRAVAMNSTTAETSFPVALVTAGFVHVPVKGNYTPTLGGGWRGQSNIEGVSRASASYDDEQTIRVTPEIAATFRLFDKKTKVKDLPAGRWAASRRDESGGTVVLTKPVLVFAEQGGLRVTNAKGETATVTGGKSAWQAFYGERDRSWNYTGGLGMKEAAKSVVDVLTRKVETRDAFAQANKGAWGGALCPVCFQRAAVTPTSNHMVDHRHQRLGWGYNVQPCEGNRYAPYKDSPAGTKARLEGLHGLFDASIVNLRDMLAHPEKQTYTVRVYVKDDEGNFIYDKVPARNKWGEHYTETVRREKEVSVKQGHPLFLDLYRKDVKARKEFIRAVADSVPFIAAAVRVWEPGLDTMSPILAATRKTDAPALPRDLFPEG